MESVFSDSRPPVLVQEFLYIDCDRRRITFAALMKQVCILLQTLLLGPGVLLVRADSVTLRQGKVIEGTFLSGSTRQVEFLAASGQTLKFPVDEITSISFAAAPAVPPPARRASGPVLVPSGTAFRVRTIDPIDVDVTQAGATFRGALDDPIMQSGEVIVPRGTEVVLVAAKVSQGGTMKGSDAVELKVNSILLRGRSYSIVTGIVETKSGGEGKKTARKIGGGAGLGAIIGGIAGGGTGAAIGALAGGVTGTAVAASGQPHLKIPSETRLEFVLRSDWKIK